MGPIFATQAHRLSGRLPIHTARSPRHSTGQFVNHATSKHACRSSPPLAMRAVPAMRADYFKATYDTIEMLSRLALRCGWPDIIRTEKKLNASSVVILRNILRRWKENKLNSSMVFCRDVVSAEVSCWLLARDGIYLRNTEFGNRLSQKAYRPSRLAHHPQHTLTALSKTS